MVIKAVIFDFGGVFTKYTKRDLFVQAGRKLGKEKEISKFTKKYHARIMTLTRKELLKRIAKLGINPLRWELVVIQLLKRRKIRKALVVLAKKLRKNGYLVPVLSNVNPITVRFNKARGWYDVFSHLILSCEVGAAKPEKKIYRIALQKIGMSPRECVFIDDHLTCIKTARDMGMRAILFRSPRQVMTELKKCGVVW
jgi:putative hydrolase of the HAD superfamily